MFFRGVLVYNPSASLNNWHLLRQQRKPMAQNTKSYNADDLAVLASRQRRRFRASENGNFYYPNCTTPELEEIEALYARRGYTVKKQLNPDCVTWFVSVELPVSNHQPRTPHCYRQRIWR